MPKLSVCIICKNEEAKIENCLQSVTWADEIVLVDSGSTDKTLTLAAKYTDKIFIREDWDGFGEQRRRAEEYASNDWILAIDSDEVISEKLANEIQSHLSQLTEQSVLVLNRLSQFCGKFIYHSGWHPDPIVRIYNKQHYQYNQNLVHESVDCKGAKKVKLKEKLLHYTFDTVEQYQTKIDRYAVDWAEDRFRKGKKISIFRPYTSALFAFIRHFIFRLGFLDGIAGLKISNIQMRYTYDKYHKLEQKNKRIYK